MDGTCAVELQQAISLVRSICTCSPSVSDSIARCVIATETNERKQHVCCCVYVFLLWEWNCECVLGGMSKRELRTVFVVNAGREREFLHLVERNRVKFHVYIYIWSLFTCISCTRRFELQTEPNGEWSRVLDTSLHQITSRKKISLFKFDVVSYGRRHSSVFNNTIYDYLMESEFDSYAILKQLCRQIDAEIRRKKRIEMLMKKFNCGFWFNNNEKTLRFVTLSVSLAYEKNNCLVNETDLIAYSNEKITCELLCHSRLI